MKTSAALLVAFLCSAACEPRDVAPNAPVASMTPPPPPSPSLPPPAPTPTETASASAPAPSLPALPNLPALSPDERKAREEKAWRALSGASPN